MFIGLNTKIFDYYQVMGEKFEDIVKYYGDKFTLDCHNSK